MFGRKREGDYAQARALMVRDQLANRGIRDERVLRAMATVPRHLFVPPDLRRRSYEDGPLPIGFDQTISQPYIVAFMTELLHLKGTERILEVGAGCGYQSAVLAFLAREICALELQAELAAEARETLRTLGIENVDLRQGDGFEPWPDGGTFDAILSACAPREVPEVLLTQLAPGGRLILPVGVAGGAQELECWKRAADGEFHRSHQGAVRFVPMRRPHTLS